jgi:cadmium resistance protein CadD (predicted permease)
MAFAMLGGAVAFAATNVDDLFLLVAWFAGGRLRTADIVLGQYAGIALLFALSAAGSLVSLALPLASLRWLGLLPILLGVILLLKPRYGEGVETRPARGVLTVAAVTAANGADNIAVYVPLFATSSAQAVALMGGAFAAMTALWCLAARALVRHPEAGAALRRWGPPAVPFALMGIGLSILLG